MKSLMKNRGGLFVLSLILLLGACGDTPPTDETTAATDTSVAMDTTLSPSRVAVAVLTPASDSDVRGTVTFSEVEDGILVDAQVSGLSPGKHGFHVHENGDCSAPDASSAGGHFAPMNDSHGAPSDSASARHVGDFGNIEADESGLSEYQRLDQVIAFEGESSIIGKAVVVHQEEDDLTSQPSGDSGPRVACGVIEMEASM